MAVAEAGRVGRGVTVVEKVDGGVLEGGEAAAAALAAAAAAVK